MSEQTDSSEALLCPRCGVPVRIGTEPAGLSMRCPHCGEDFFIPDRKEILELPCPRCGKPIRLLQDHLSPTGLCPHCRTRVPIPLAAALVEETADDLPRAFSFRCHRCGSILEGRTEQIGRTGQCPTCEAVFVIPTPGSRKALAIAQPRPEDEPGPHPVHAYAAAGHKAPQIVEVRPGHLAIRCSRCATMCPVDADACPACGVPFTIDAATRRALPTGTDGFAVASMVLGIVAIVTAGCVVGGVVGIIAIVFGAIGLQRLGQPGGARRGRGMAIAGVACGTVALVAAGAILLLALV